MLLQNIANLQLRVTTGAARQDKKFERLFKSFDRILQISKVNNDSFEHIEKKVVIYTKRRYERENMTLEFQRKVQRILDKKKEIEIALQNEKNWNLKLSLYPE
jgi:hypothetical protein